MQNSIWSALALDRAAPSFGASAFATLLLVGMITTASHRPADAAPQIAAFLPPPTALIAMDTIIVSRQDVKAGIAAGTIILIDVREPDEFATGRIAGARAMPLSSFNPAALPRESGKQVVLYCQSGRRALIVHGLAIASGRSDIAVYSGSMLDWRAAGEPIEK